MDIKELITKLQAFPLNAVPQVTVIGIGSVDVVDVKAHWPADGDFPPSVRLVLHEGDTDAEDVE